jgi:hypothetical protein
MTTVSQACNLLPWQTFERARRRLYRARIYQATRRSLRLLTPALERPIFLLGTVRSGTTLLARLLGAHPQVLYAGFELSQEWVEIAGMEIAGPGLPCPHCPPLGERDARPAAIPAIRSAFARLHLAKGGWSRTRLLNKNPHLWNKVDYLRALFPDACFVITSRDLASTVASTKLLWEKMAADWGVRHYLPEDRRACWSCIPPAAGEDLPTERLFPGGSAAVLAEYWLRTYEEIERALEGAPGVANVQHAELIEQPMDLLARVDEALGLSTQRTAIKEHLDAKRNRRWRDLLAPAEVQEIESFMVRERPRIETLRSVAAGAE